MKVLKRGLAWKGFILPISKWHIFNNCACNLIISNFSIGKIRSYGCREAVPEVVFSGSLTQKERRIIATAYFNNNSLSLL